VTGKFSGLPKQTKARGAASYLLDWIASDILYFIPNCMVSHPLGWLTMQLGKAGSGNHPYALCLWAGQQVVVCI